LATNPATKSRAQQCWKWSRERHTAEGPGERLRPLDPDRDYLVRLPPGYAETVVTAKGGSAVTRRRVPLVPPDDRAFLSAMARDGRPFLTPRELFTPVLVGTGQFLPHDERFLGMIVGRLFSLHGCRGVHSTAHDRVSLGGAPVAAGLLHLWLAGFPLKQPPSAAGGYATGRLTKQSRKPWASTRWTYCGPSRRPSGLLHGYGVEQAHLHAEAALRNLARAG
jgi:hypothetical protein